MQDLTAKRTLVKSPPELWEELSEVQRLAKHLGAFGEITITKLEPEHTVAWEGEHASGTVSIEPSGWGTKVILTAELAANGDPPEPGADHAGEPAGAGEKAAGDIAEMEATADEAAGDIAETEATADEAAGDIAEMDATSEKLAAHLDAAHPPVGEIPPAAALTFDPAAAPATGAGPRTGAAARTAPPRRRRGFWARLFGGWLAPEERLNRMPVEPPYEAPTIPPKRRRPRSTARAPARCSRRYWTPSVRRITGHTRGVSLTAHWNPGLFQSASPLDATPDRTENRPMAATRRQFPAGERLGRGGPVVRPGGVRANARPAERSAAGDRHAPSGPRGRLRGPGADA